MRGINFWEETERGGSVPRRKASRDLLDGWKNANFPTHYCTDQNGNRLLSNADRRELLDDRAHPWKAKMRALKGEIEYRQRLKKLQGS
jgi:hypothetical protein